MKDTTFNAVAQRILPGQTRRVATGRRPLGREEVVWLHPWPVSEWLWGAQRVAVLSPYVSSTGAGQVALIGRTVGSGKAPTSSPAGRTHTRIVGRSDECVRPDGSPSRWEEDPRRRGGSERRDQAPLRDGVPPWGRRAVTAASGRRTMIAMAMPERRCINGVGRRVPSHHHSGKANGSPLAFFFGGRRGGPGVREGPCGLCGSASRPVPG